MKNSASPEKPKPSFENINPISQGDKGLITLRATKDCPIPKEAQRLNDLIQRVAQMAPSDETLNTLAQGIAIIMQADRFCDQQVKNRVVLKFADDTELNELTRAIMTLGEETKKMDEQLQTKLHELRGMLKARWDLSVKKFGLNPVERIYTVDEGREEINLVELECVGCKGATKIRKVRQDVTAAVAQLVRDKIDTGEHLQSKGETA